MKSQTKSQRKGNCHFHPFNTLISNQWACIIKHDTLNSLSWATGAIAPQWCSSTQITSHTPTTRLFLTIKRWLEPRIMPVNRVKKRNTTNWPSIKSSFTNAKWFATKDSLSIRHLCPIVASVIRDTCILAPFRPWAVFRARQLILVRAKMATYYVPRSTQWPLPTRLFETPRVGAIGWDYCVLYHLHSPATLLNGCHWISLEMKTAPALLCWRLKLALFNGIYWKLNLCSLPLPYLPYKHSQRNINAFVVQLIYNNWHGRPKCCCSARGIQTIS